LSSNIGEVVTIFVASLLAVVTSFNLGLPLLPIHLLWINLITDSLPAFGLGMEKADESVMSEEPRSKSEGFFANRLGFHIALEGIFVGAITLASYLIGDLLLGDLALAQTMAFVTLSSTQLFHAFNVKNDGTIFTKKTFNNKMLNIAFLVGMTLQFIVVYTPGINTVFKLEALGIVPLSIAMGLALSVVAVMEVYKLFKRIINKK
jgi:Ca2+-transporting ATPase